MALGIRDFDDIYTEYSIPLIWDDNTILANHLRWMADEIEKLKKPILDIKLSTPIRNSEFSKPCLEVITLRERTNG